MMSFVVANEGETVSFGIGNIIPICCGGLEEGGTYCAVAIIDSSPFLPTKFERPMISNEAHNASTI